MKQLTIGLAVVAALLLGSTAQAQCDESLISEVAEMMGKYNYLKDYRVRSAKPKKRQKLPPKVAYNIILNKGKKYRFLINSSEELPGELKFEMYARERGLVLTNYDGERNKYYNGVEFLCKATAMYTITVSFSDGQEGCGVVIVGFDDRRDYLAP